MRQTPILDSRDDYLAAGRRGFGTEWVAPNEGEYFGTLYDAFRFADEQGTNKHPLLFSIFQAAQIAGIKSNRITRDVKTNLKLTRLPITAYDWQRLESDAFRIGA